MRLQIVYSAAQAQGPEAGFNPTWISMGLAASPRYALGVPSVKGGNRVPQAAAGGMREPKPSIQEPTLPHTLRDTGITNRLVLLAEGELRKA